MAIFFKNMFTVHFFFWLGNVAFDAYEFSFIDDTLPNH